MESHEVVRQALDKISPKEVAAEMGVSLSLVYKWAQPDDNQGSGTANPLDRVLQLYELTKDDHLLQWLCSQAAGVFVKNPPSTCKRGFEVMPATQEIVQQFADLLAAISQAAVDNSICDEEAKGIRHVWDELKRYTEGFVRCCEEGDFKNLNEELHKPHHI
jgi:transcriptional regulator with XRE-family HTH domain